RPSARQADPSPPSPRARSPSWSAPWGWPRRRVCDRRAARRSSHPLQRAEVRNEERERILVRADAPGADTETPELLDPRLDRALRVHGARVDHLAATSLGILDLDEPHGRHRPLERIVDEEAVRVVAPR